MKKELLAIRTYLAPSFSVGFTLIELLVAMTVIAVLAGLALVSYQGARKTARDGQRKADLEKIRSALEMFRADEGYYPGSLGSLSGYIAAPSDPLSPTYNYRYNGSADAYTLCAYLESGSLVTSCSGSCGADCGSGVACNYKTCNP